MNKLPPDILEYIAKSNIPVYHLLLNSIPRLIRKQGLHKRAVDHFTVKNVNNIGVEYWLNGKIYREDGPAIKYNYSCYEAWVLNGELHRVDGPAVITSHGTQYWYLNGVRHREDGPAIIRTNGYEEYWLNGVEQKIINIKGCYE